MITKTLKALIVATLFSSVAYADSLDLGLIGLSSHGYLDSYSWSQMRGHISKTGYVVWNAEFNLTYQHNNWLFNSSYIDDCFGRSAYYFGVGYSWRITKTFSAGLIGGVFLNHFYHYDVNSKTGQVVRTYAKKQINITPLVSLQKDFMLTNNFGVFVNLSSNYILTHSFVGVKTKF